MTKLYSPIVGISFRPPEAKELFASLPVGTPIILSPEPENPHDPEAIKVCVRNDLGDVIHLGYIPRSGGKFDTTGNGNKEILEFMQAGPDWDSTLSFSPEGKALVCIEFPSDQ